MLYAGLTERTLRCQSGMFERKVWSLAPAAGCPTAAILFLDAELCLERVGAAAVVWRLQERRAVPPATAVFLSHGGAAVSHEDSSAAPKYARFVARDLVGSVRRSTRRDRDRDRRPEPERPRGRRTRRPATRPSSGRRYASRRRSWWERGRFAQELPPATPTAPEFWISVVSRETEAGASHPPSGLRQGLTQVAGCVSAAAALRGKGHSVSYREYDGDHDPDCWCDDLSLALPWIWRRG
jgi:hypothetical protein